MSSAMILVDIRDFFFLPFFFGFWIFSGAELVVSGCLLDGTVSRK